MYHPDPPAAATASNIVLDTKVKIQILTKGKVSNPNANTNVGNSMAMNGNNTAMSGAESMGVIQRMSEKVIM